MKITPINLQALRLIIGGCLFLLLMGCGGLPEPIESGQQQVSEQKEETEIETKGDVKTETVQKSEQKQQQSSVESKDIEGDVQTYAYQLDKQRRLLRQEMQRVRQVYQLALSLVIVGMLLMAANTDRWFPMWISPAVWLIVLVTVIGAFAVPLIYNLVF